MARVCIQRLSHEVHRIGAPQNSLLDFIQYRRVPQRNSLFGSFLDGAWNKVDKKRIEEVGAEMAAAEWIMRCGGSVKWKNHAKWIKDYNQLAMGTGAGTKIEEIDATEASIMGEGFGYFNGLNSVRKIRFHKTHHIDDAALSRLSILSQTLEDLEVSSCGNVSERGVKSLSQLSNLRRLLLYDLPGVKKLNDCVQHLNSSLPQCNISTSSGGTPAGES